MIHAQLCFKGLDSIQDKLMLKSTKVFKILASKPGLSNCGVMSNIVSLALSECCGWLLTTKNV